MAEDVQVLADGAEETAPRPGPRSPWLIGVVGLMVGIAIGAVFFAPIVAGDDSAPTTAPTVADADSPEVSTDVGTTEAIPGFIDALVAVATSDTDSLTHVIWPRLGPLVEHSMAAGETALFDATAQHIALTETVPGMDGVVLSVGRYSSIEPAASGVRSFAWHDTASKHMGYTTSEDGRWTLWHMTPDLLSHQVSTGSGSDFDLVAWGDWGWAIQTPGEVILLDSEAELSASIPGVGLTSSPDGWVLLSGDTLRLAREDGTVLDLGVGAGIVGPGSIVDASISPKGDRVAISGPEVTLVLSIDEPSEAPLARFALLSADGLTWTSDGRFVLVPTGAGLLILDPETGGISRVLGDYPLLAVDVVPPVGS